MEPENQRRKIEPHTTELTSHVVEDILFGFPAVMPPTCQDELSHERIISLLSASPTLKQRTFRTSPFPMVSVAAALNIFESRIAYLQSHIDIFESYFENVQREVEMASSKNPTRLNACIRAVIILDNIGNLLLNHYVEVFIHNQASRDVFDQNSSQGEEELYRCVTRALDEFNAMKIAYDDEFLPLLQALNPDVMVKTAEEMFAMAGE